MTVTRTVGAAIGLGAVLLFFASLTIQEARVSTSVTHVAPVVAQK